MITDGQMIHRQYLQSPVWKAKRVQALAHYGTVCGRCGCHGTDVHHKTYERVGGNELMEDLEVLCRPCHEAHHQAERCARAAGRKPGKKQRGIHHQAVYQCLTGAQREAICAKLRITSGDLYVRLRASGGSREMEIALSMLGMDYAYGFIPNSSKNLRNAANAPRVDSCRVRDGEIGSGRKTRGQAYYDKKKAKAVAWHEARMAEYERLKANPF